MPIGLVGPEMSSQQRSLLPVLLPELAESLRAALGEDGVRELSERYVSLVEHVPVVVYIGEFDRASTLRYVTPRIEALTGRTPEELLADDDEWYRCIHPDDLDAVREREIEAWETETEF